MSLRVWFEVIRQHKVLSILCFEECIRESDNADFLHLWILAEFWIDVEKYRHVHLLERH